MRQSQSARRVLQTHLGVDTTFGIETQALHLSMLEHPRVRIRGINAGRRGLQVSAPRQRIYAITYAYNRQDKTRGGDNGDNYV